MRRNEHISSRMRPRSFRGGGAPGVNQLILERTTFMFSWAARSSEKNLLYPCNRYDTPLGSLKIHQKLLHDPNKSVLQYLSMKLEIPNTVTIWGKGQCCLELRVS